jgi:hypothetical protein
MIFYEEIILFGCKGVIKISCLGGKKNLFGGKKLILKSLFHLKKNIKFKRVLNILRLLP